jgi:hypothetical protein
VIQDRALRSGLIDPFTVKDVRATLLSALRDGVDAGRLVRRLLREMDSLWVFLAHHGVEPTNNRAERALRFAVMWRKCSSGTESDKGNRWVERTLSLRQIKIYS